MPHGAWPWYCNVCGVSGVLVSDEPCGVQVLTAGSIHKSKSPDCPSEVRFVHPADWYRILLSRPSTGRTDFHNFPRDYPKVN